ncbi:melanoregulin isoform X2 [Tyto alba]|uniref:melanoregulin isoform X2 n=1 Tax=Tyto alba TaxID=56313 RepID=UPI001C67C695|nr:melanoregulin isoform X2 [Tyto alba]
MGLGAWLRSLGGCCGCCGGEAAPPPPEKEPLLSNNNPYASFGATLARDEEQNLWSTPHDVTHTEADDDRVLYNMIVVRNQLDKDSEEWQKLNYDIYTLRQTRKEVRSRWKHILEDLGFQKEVDSLLSVTKLSIISDSQNMGKARDFLLKLAEETNIFPTSWELSERYLFVVVKEHSWRSDGSLEPCSVIHPTWDVPRGAIRLAAAPTESAVPSESFCHEARWQGRECCYLADRGLA